MPEKTPEHYFYKNYEGICARKMRPSGTWSVHEQIIGGASKHFSVCCDENGNVHLICTDVQNNLIYAMRKNGIWKKHTVSSLKETVSVRKMCIYVIADRPNFLYSAKCGEKMLLIHCILGNHAKPSVVATLEDEDFCICGSRAYFTNSAGTFGFVSLSDEKPTEFTPLYDDAHTASVCGFGDDLIIVFARGNSLYINGREILENSKTEHPICVNCKNTLYVMWQDGTFVRYMSGADADSLQNKPMRFLGTGAPPTLFTLNRYGSFEQCYGCRSGNKIILFGAKEL